jgi:diguanylate cyclase (GGDEF)-like protein
MLAVMFLDLDQFKRINDSLGHRVGDLLLQQVAVRLQDCVRSADRVYATHSDLLLSRDVLARLGGDEFVILTEINDPDDIAKVARRILTVIAQPFMIDSNEVFSGCSIGIALYPLDGADMETLLKNADAALYHAKSQGRNNYQLYSDRMHAATIQHVEMEGLLRKALARQELTLHYQPQVDIGSGRIVGVEALLRWQSQELGSVAPADFIPVAEDTGLIVPIGEWVIRTACAQAVAWQNIGLPPLRIAVNLSPRQFADPELSVSIARILQETGLRSELLEFEITESLVMKEGMLETLHALKRLGVQLAIDDFGTGYSNLSYLRRFPIDRLKIDKSFVQDISGEIDDDAIAAAVIAMARSLRLGVIAEGVETETQLMLLRAMNCDEMQGFLFSRPHPTEHITALLRDHFAQA